MLDVGKSAKEISEGVFHPGYLLVGNASLRKKKWLETLAYYFLNDESSRASGLERVDGRERNLLDLLDELNMPTLFSGGKKIIVIDDPPYLSSTKSKGKKKDEEKKKEEAGEEEGEEKEEGASSRSSGEDKKRVEALQNFYKRESSNPEPENILVFRVENVDRRKTFYRNASKLLALIDCSPLEGNDLKKWTARNFKSHGKEIDGQALEKLLWLTEGDMWRLEQEVAKICNYLDEDQSRVTADVVEELVYGGPQGNIFRLVDAVGEGKTLQAYRSLQGLLDQQEPPILIAHMITRQFRLIFQSLSLQEQGLPPASAAEELNVKPFVARKVYQQARSYNRSQLRQIFEVLEETDYNLKTGKLEGPLALEVLISRLANLK